jgi:hypothetical protein
LWTSSGGHCRSASNCTVHGLAAYLNPAEKAASWPKLRANDRYLTRGSAAASALTRSRVASVEPSSTKITSTSP